MARAMQHVLGDSVPPVRAFFFFCPQYFLLCSWPYPCILSVCIGGVHFRRTSTKASREGAGCIAKDTSIREATNRSRL